MEKLTAFDLYNVNDRGGHQPVARDSKLLAGGIDVYLASDVDALLENIKDARLQWSMLCECDCPACIALDKSLMGT